MSKKKKDEAKTHSLTKDEKERLEGMKGMSYYIQGLIRDDMSRFIDTTIKQRLQIDRETLVSVDIEHGKVTTIPEPAEGGSSATPVVAKAGKEEVKESSAEKK